MGYARIFVSCLAMGAWGCGVDVDGGGEASPSEASPEAFGSTQSALAPQPLRGRAAAAAQLRIGTDLQEWVFACDAAGWLRHRVRYGDGTWGSWRNHQHPCSGPPSVAVYKDAAGNELPVAYYRSGMSVMETAWTSSSSSSTVNLSEYTGYGDTLHDPVVSYYDKATGDVSVLSLSFPDGDTYSLDAYDRRWHVNLVAHSMGTDMRVFFSYRSQRAFFSMYVGGNADVYGREDAASGYSLIGRFGAGVMGFGGASTSCRDGCLLRGTSQLSWARISATPSWSSSDTGNTWAQMVSTPTVRPGGDPGQAYGVGATSGGLPNGELVGVHMIDGWRLSYGGKISFPTSEVTLTTNVYAGSRYETDGFVATTPGSNRLYRIFYDDFLANMGTQDLGLNVTVGAR